MTNKLYIVCALLICTHLQAQYAGGNNDGNDISSLNGSRLNGTIASFSVLFQGSSGDGQDNEGRQLLLASSDFEIYQGSSGDGFSQNNATVTIAGDDINSLYVGNSGDGHSQNDFQTLIGGDDLSVLYKGSIGDGSDFGLLSSVFLEGFMVAIFEGGSGDGFSSLLKPNNYLSGLMLTLFNGGNGDGFAVNTFTSTLTLDLVEQLIKLNVLLYPNPASHIVNIKPNEGLVITAVNLYDISGKKVNINLSDNSTLDVSNLSDGIYLLNIFSDNGSVTKKLIVKK